MDTSSKKTASKPSASTASVSKTTPKKTAAIPAEKTVAMVTKKAVPAPAKKVSAKKPEKLANKPASTEKIAPKKSAKKNTVTPEARYHMIATAAYFLGEQRGFQNGCAINDWISAEAQVEAMLNGEVHTY